ncbi:hypothetical protein PFISCL1PPCAC_21480, partial [Pristionchus fissidentatus]
AINPSASHCPQWLPIYGAPRVLGDESKSICSEHNRDCEWLCSCAKKICHECATGLHNSHFGYADLFMLSGQLNKEMNEMELQRKILNGERNKVARRKHEINNLLISANKDIASKFTRIIAPAISRCLDLMNQVTELGNIRNKELDDYNDVIDAALNKIQKASSMANRGKESTNLSTTLCVTKAAFAM